MFEKIDDMLQSEPDKPNEELIKGLKCSCCGKEIINLNWVECVMNPYEVLCMSCYRADYKDNQRVLHENANNYRLRTDLKRIDNEKRNLSSLLRSKSMDYEDLEEKYDEYTRNIIKSVQEAYECALQCDSGTAIMIIKDLKDKIRIVKK